MEPLHILVSIEILAWQYFLIPTASLCHPTLLAAIVKLIFFHQLLLLSLLLESLLLLLLINWMNIYYVRLEQSDQSNLFFVVAKIYHQHKHFMIGQWAWWQLPNREVRMSEPSKLQRLAKKMANYSNCEFKMSCFLLFLFYQLFNLKCIPV